MTAETPRAAHPAAVRGLAPGTGDQGNVSPVPGHTLTAAQLDTVIEALEDAAAYRWDRDIGCGCCDDAAGGLCDDHRADARKGIRYASLAAQLEKAAGL